MIALTTPLVLSALPPLAGLFIYAYLRHGRGKKITVASVMFLKKLPRISSARAKLHIPWKLILELICLALLLLGIAGLYREQIGSRVIVVIDNSLSSGAILRSTGRSALEQEKQLALEQLSNLDAQALVTLAITSPVSIELNSIPQSAQSLLESVRNIKAGYGSDGLEGTLARYLSNPEVDQILVFSDRRIQQEQSIKRLQLFNPRKLDDPRDNIAISNFQLFESQPGKFGAEVTVSSYARQSFSADISLQSVLLNSDLKEITRQRLNLAAHSTQTVRFNDISDAKAIRVAIQESNDISTKSLNALPDDDAAFLTRDLNAANLLLVGPVSAQSLGLEGLRGLKFQWLDSKTLSTAALNAALKNARGVVFHRVTPVTLPNTSALFVSPPNDSALFPPLKDSSGGPVAHWNATHALLKYINLATLNLKHSATFALPPWGEQLLSLPQGIVLFAGETQGNKFVVSGFELFPFEGKNSPVLSILTLNIFNWLFASSDASAAFEPGARVPQIDGFKTANLIPLNLDLKLEQIVPAPGILVVTDKDAESKLFVYNFYSSTESDLENTAPITLSLNAENVKSSQQPQSLKNILAVALLALLSFELVMRLRSFTPKARRSVN